MERGTKAMAEWVAAAAAVFYLAAAGSPGVAQAQYTATTTVRISVCGDGIVEYPEVCDDGVNSGAYATSSANRHCAPGCMSWGPYCGDGILQTAYGEQCDDGALNGTPGDGCSATCQIESLAPLPGPGPMPAAGGGPYSPGSPTPPNPTQVILEGEAYPGASVNILYDGATLGVVQADTSGNFYFSTTNVSPGVATFGIWAQDASGLKSVALTSTFTITANDVTRITGELLPPTITLSSRQVAPGSILTLSGQSVPSVTVEAHFHSSSTVTVTTSTDSNGFWRINFDTAPLAANAIHTVNTDFVTTQNGATARSTLSESVSFFLGTKNIGNRFKADLNGDGRVNLADFSILLYYWGTSNPIADLNGDGIVDIQDLSILLYYWTG